MAELFRSIKKPSPWASHLSNDFNEWKLPPDLRSPRALVTLCSVLSKLTEMNGQKAHEFALGGRLDVNLVAAMGHSSGEAFATLAC
jgi:hypothetical protein